MVPNNPSFLRGLGLAAACVTLTACDSSSKERPLRPEELPAGRYAIINIPGTQEMIQMDTANGKSWRLDWSEDEDGTIYPTGWTSLDD